MRVGIVMAATVALAGCSQDTPDPAQHGHSAPTRIDAAALVRAYGQDADEADVAFVGHPLLISGDVVRLDPNGHRLQLTTGSAVERLPAVVMTSPHPLSLHDLITVRCDRIDRDGNRPRVSGCTITGIIPARIARGG